MTQPYVSIIIPTVNSPWLKTILTRLQGQTFDMTQAEIIVIGLDEAGVTTEFPAVRFIDTETRHPPAWVRNRGIEAAQGEILCFLDDDCLPERTWLANLVAPYGSGAKVVGGSIMFPQDDYWTVVDTLAFFANVLPKTSSGERADLPSLNFSAHRTVFEDVGLFDTEFPLPAGEDTELTRRMAAQGYRLHFVAEAVVFHVARRGSFKKIWQRAWHFGEAVAVNPELQNLLHPSPWLRHWLGIYLTAIPRAAVATAKIFQAYPALLQYKAYFGGLFLSKLAWQLGAGTALRGREITVSPAKDKTMTVPSFQEFKDYLATIKIVTDGVDEQALLDNQQELLVYRLNHSYRLWRSLQLLTARFPADKPLRVLELGSAPYLFSALMYDYFDYEVIGANVEAGVMPETASEIRRASVTLRHGFEGRVDDFPTYVFNFELDDFPFEDHEFDVVLCMEVIEHLAYDPIHMLAEANRVLKPGGLLLLTTPNAIDMHKTLRMIRNRSIAFEYSGYGVYGRHNREFTAAELAYLAQASGFEDVAVELENVYLNGEAPPKHHPLYLAALRLSELPLSYFKNKREYLMLTARGTGHVRRDYPDDFYYFVNLYPNASSKQA